MIGRITQAFGSEAAAASAVIMAEVLGFSASKFFNPTLGVWIVAVNRR